MATMAMDKSAPSRGMTSEERLVIFASSLGTVFEWYDFYIYGTLGVFLAKYFFSNVPANVGFIFTLLAFAAGFSLRRLCSLVAQQGIDHPTLRNSAAPALLDHACYFSAESG